MYKLSNLAAKDFEGIFEYTLVNFGVSKADEYTKSLHCALEMLSSNPLIGLKCAEISEGLGVIIILSMSFLSAENQRYLCYTSSSPANGTAETFLF